MELPTERLILPSGAWADLETVVTYGVRRRVLLALAHQRQRIDAEARLRSEGELCIAMTRAWSLTDGAGAPLPLTLEGIDQAGAGDVDALFARAVALFTTATTPSPKAGAS